MHQVGTTHLGAPWWVVVPTWAPSLIPSHHTVTYLQKKFSVALSLSRVLTLKSADFDLFSRSSVSETISGDCCLVCDSTVCPNSYCFSYLYFEKLATLGATVDELAC